MFYLYTAFIVLGIIILLRKRCKSIFYLPFILLFIEISRIVFISSNISAEGFNGLIFIVLFLFIAFNFTLSNNKRYLTLVLLIMILSVYLAFRTSIDTGILNVISRVGTFSLILLVLPTAYIKKNAITHDELKLILRKLVLIFFAFVIIASLLKFGTNHYNTNIIFGFKFEQWYFGALLLAIYPFFLISKNKKTRHYLLYLIFLILIFLVLRRTVWFIIIFSSVLSIWLLRRYFLKQEFMTIIVGLGLFVMAGIFITNYLDLWTMRGQRSLNINYLINQDYEDEGRFLEVEYALYTLQLNDQIYSGSGYLFDDVGKYNFPNVHRPIHGTYTKIFFGAGLIGLIMYVFILMSIIYYLYSPRIYKDYLHAVVFSSLLTYLFVLATGASGHNVGAPYVATLFILSGYIMPYKRING